MELDDTRNEYRVVRRNYVAPELMPLFLARVSMPSLSLDQCWDFNGANDNGYGAFTVKRRRFLAHRYNLEQTNGPLSPYLTVDHLCRNRKCVRPSHLELVTQRENQHRGQGTSGKNHQKTECLNGHVFNYVVPKTGSRHCSICDNAKRRQRLGSTRTPGGLFCFYGHAYTVENTYIDPKRKRRACKACRLKAKLKFMEKHHGVR